LNTFFKYLFLIIFANCVNAQNLILKPYQKSDLISSELKMKSELIKNIGKEYLGQEIYPYEGEYNLSQPINFRRFKTDFHLNAECEYFFDKENNQLRFFSMNWIPLNQISEKDFTFSKYNEILKRELSKNKEYIAFYKSVKDKIISEYGLPSQVEISKDDLYTKSVWVIDNIKIISELFLAEQLGRDFMGIKYQIYWI